LPIRAEEEAMTRLEPRTLLMVAAVVLVGIGVAGGGWWLAGRAEETAPPPAALHAPAGPSAAGLAQAAVTFHVPTITCPACPLRVEASVRKAPGIIAVAFEVQDVTVTYDPSQVTPDEIAAAIVAGGDTVHPVEA
jgi:copper chaperone CopZ